jgi:hypothetical protein
MRVTIAAVVLLVALVRAESASAYAGPASDSARAVAASICAEPTRLVEVVVPGAASSVTGVMRVERAERGLAEEGSTLWCVSPDDPRCSPLESSSHEGMSFARAKLGFAAGELIDPPTPRELAAVSGSSEYRGSARDGVSGPLERPPNARVA